MAQEIIRLTDTGTFAELKTGVRRAQPLADQFRRSDEAADRHHRRGLHPAHQRPDAGGVPGDPARPPARGRAAEAARPRSSNEFQTLESQVDGLNSEVAVLKREARLLRPGRDHAGGARSDRAQEHRPGAHSGSPGDAGRRDHRAEQADADRQRSSANMPSRSRSCASCSTSAPRSTSSARRTLVDSAVGFVNTAKSRVSLGAPASGPDERPGREPVRRQQHDGHLLRHPERGHQGRQPPTTRRSAKRCRSRRPAAKT